MAVINVGCYVWINNSVAVVPDGDPGTMVLVWLYDVDFNPGHGDPSDDVYAAPRPDEAGSRAQAVIHSNGDQDDNRMEHYFYRRGVTPDTPHESGEVGQHFQRTIYRRGPEGFRAPESHACR